MTLDLVSRISTKPSVEQEASAQPAGTTRCESVLDTCHHLVYHLDRAHSIGNKQNCSHTLKDMDTAK